MHYLRLIFPLALLALVAVPAAAATTAADYLCALPDSVLPYLPQAKRKELVALKSLDNGTPATITGTLTEPVTLTAMNDTLLTLSLAEGATLEVGRLITERGDTVFCTIRTVLAPLADSEILVDGKPFAPAGDTDAAGDFTLTEAHFGHTPQEITVTRRTPYQFADDKEKTPAPQSTKLKWDGEKYK